MEKLLIPRKEAARLLSISEDTLDFLCETGAISRITIGTRVYYSPEALKAFVTKEGPLC